MPNAQSVLLKTSLIRTLTIRMAIGLRVTMGENERLSIEAFFTPSEGFQIATERKSNGVSHTTRLASYMDAK